jgi:hypothetical protein
LEKETGGYSSAPATPVDEATQLSMGTLQGYFASRPPPGQRTQQIEKLTRPSIGLRHRRGHSPAALSSLCHLPPSVKGLRRFADSLIPQTYTRPECS